MSPQAVPPRAELLGVPVHILTPAEAVAHITAMVEERTPHHVVTVNPEFIMMARRNSAFRTVLCQADLSLPDGIGVVWACRLMGYPLSERVTGVDTLTALAGVCAGRGFRPFLLGAGPGVAEKAGEVLRRAHPGLEIAGTYAGSPSPAEEDHIVSLVRAARPDLLFVAYGAPQQDLWIARNLARSEVPVAMGVGGAFDFLAGVTPRAPKWMQDAGLEWLYRLLRQPWRWRRMVVLPRFALLMLIERYFPHRQ